MEHALTCNNLKCRSELAERALVTTCSHIFCIQCADSLGVTDQAANRPTSCPACKSQLSNPDDAVIAKLNPSEDYKTSVLSGLSPNIIMECAGRALSFWAYQTTQDIYYQQYLYKNMSDKYSSLHVQLDKTVNDANSEMEVLQQKLQGLMADHDVMRRKNEELAAKYHDKNRKLLQIQELYDKVKRQAAQGDIQRAASDAHPPAFGQTPRHTASGAGAGASASNMNVGVSRVNLTSAGMQGQGRWQGQGTTSQPGQVNTAHVGGAMRQRLGPPAMGPPPPPEYNAHRGTPVPDNHSPRRSTDHAAPNFGLNRAGLHGIGLTSGLKVSQPASVAGLNTCRRTR